MRLGSVGLAGDVDAVADALRLRDQDRVADVVAHPFRRHESRRELAGVVLDLAGELTAADLSGVFGWRRKESAAILDGVAVNRDDEAGFRIWTRR